jgi:hypothetical protein
MQNSLVQMQTSSFKLNQYIMDLQTLSFYLSDDEQMLSIDKDC